MKKIKPMIALVVALAAMAVGVWGDRQLDARYQTVDMSAPTAIVTAAE